MFLEYHQFTESLCRQYSNITVKQLDLVIFSMMWISDRQLRVKCGLTKCGKLGWMWKTQEMISA